MTQLILDTTGYNLTLPESRKGGYTAGRQALSEDVEMITGRMVRELRGTVWVIRYQFGFLNDEEKNLFLSVCEKGRESAITCGFLAPSSSGALTYSRFLVTEMQYPKFMWSRQTNGGGPVPLWGNFEITLREVAPSD